MTAQIKRIFRRRAAVEPVIGHCKEEHRMGRNYLAHAEGDAINAVLAASGYNFAASSVGWIGSCALSWRGRAHRPHKLRHEKQKLHGRLIMPPTNMPRCAPG